MKRQSLTRTLFAFFVTAACAQQEAEPQQAALSCEAPRLLARLPRQFNEASGLAPSLRHPGIWWLLVDDGPAVLTAIDSTGAVRATIQLNKARNRDWESLTAARCGSTFCLYVGDIGDNDRARDRVTVYRIVEPDLRDGAVDATAISFRYPTGPVDAEAIFVLPDEQLYVVTKGRSAAITVFKYPGRLDPQRTVTLEPVQTLSQSFVQLPEMVTGAGATPDGQWIVLRTYSALQVYRLENGFLAPRLPGPGLALSALQEFQGEGVDLLPSGQIALVSEKGLSEQDAPLSMVRCTFKAGS